MANQFESSPNRKGKMAITLMTTLADLSLFKDHNNLLFRGRIGWVQKDVVTKLGKKPVFSVVLLLHDGLADLNVWDIKRHADWLQALNFIVEIEGLTCSRRSDSFAEQYAKAPGDLMLHANVEKYRIVVHKGNDDPNIPANPNIPDQWFRQKSMQSQQGGSAPGTLTRGMGSQSAQRCCDAPDGLTCKVTGALHVRVSVCTTCKTPINPKQPFCGEQMGAIRCEAVKSQPAHPFSVLDATKARERESTPSNELDENPLSKVLKF